MPLNYKYKRNFIILNEKDRGYETAKDNSPTGYVGIEIRNNKLKIRSFIQNIIVDSKSEYKLLLKDRENKKAEEIGRFRIDKDGRGEISYESGFIKYEDIPEYSSAIVVSGENIVLFGGSDIKKEAAPFNHRFHFIDMDLQ